MRDHSKKYPRWIKKTEVKNLEDYYNSKDFSELEAFIDHYYLDPYEYHPKRLSDTMQRDIKTR